MGVQLVFEDLRFWVLEESPKNLFDFGGIGTFHAKTKLHREYGKFSNFFRLMIVIFHIYLKKI